MFRAPACMTLWMLFACILESSKPGGQIKKFGTQEGTKRIVFTYPQNINVPKDAQDRICNTILHNLAACGYVCEIGIKADT